MMRLTDYFVALGVVLVVWTGTVHSNLDERCSCKCPEVAEVFGDNSTISLNNDFPTRKIYINSTVKAVDCDCEHVIQPVLSLDISQMEKLCPRCRCTHEERSTTTIKVVVILILWILCILAVYLLYLVCVDPMFKAKQVVTRRGLSSNLPYQQQEDDNVIDNDVTATPLRSYGGVMDHRSGGMVNRLGRETDRWKRQVEIQRLSVYDRHTMLN